jgi:hypothetical protein
MGIQRVGLKYHREVACARPDTIDLNAVDAHLTGALRLQARNDAQQGRLAATGRTDQRDEFAVFDRQIDTLQNLRRVECLADLVQFDLGHFTGAPNCIAAMDVD